jgi:hypothetical protein
MKMTDGAQSAPSVRAELETGFFRDTRNLLRSDTSALHALCFESKNPVSPAKESES